MRIDTDALRAQTHSLEPRIDRLRGLFCALRELIPRTYAQSTLLMFSTETESARGVRRCKLLDEIHAGSNELAQLVEFGDTLVALLTRIAENTEDVEQLVTQLWQCQARRSLSLLSSPLLVDAVRTMTSTIDAATAPLLAGAAGLFAQRVLTRVGPDFTAALLTVPLDVFAAKNQTLSAHRQATATTLAPTSLAELAARVPEAQAGAPQVRIERYHGENSPTWVVYAAGTVAMRPNARGEPWDMTSNLKLMAGQESDSIKGAKQAMQSAGIRDSDHVVFVGFSQGGMLAATLASSDRTGQTDLVTFGAPTAHIDLAAVNSAISFEHDEDLVPALAGSEDLGNAEADRVIVRESVYGASPDANSGGELLPAHNLDRYEETARIQERSSSVVHSQHAELSGERVALLSRLRGTGESSLWRVNRG